MPGIEAAADLPAEMSDWRGGPQGRSARVDDAGEDLREFEEGTIRAEALAPTMNVCTLKPRSPIAWEWLCGFR